jgi:hypothetical protein
VELRFGSGNFPFSTVELVFLDEYAKTGVRDDNMECTRYIVPILYTTYTVYIDVKSNFKFGKRLGLRIKMFEEETNHEINSEKFEKKDGKIIQIEKVCQAKNVIHVSMNALSSGNTAP